MMIMIMMIMIKMIKMIIAVTQSILKLGPPAGRGHIKPTCCCCCHHHHHQISNLFNLAIPMRGHTWYYKDLWFLSLLLSSSSSTLMSSSSSSDSNGLLRVHLKKSMIQHAYVTEYLKSNPILCHWWRNELGGWGRVLITPQKDDIIKV